MSLPFDIDIRFRPFRFSAHPFPLPHRTDCTCVSALEEFVRLVMKTHKSKSKSQSKKPNSKNPQKKTLGIVAPDCPYRAGTLYGTLFSLGRDYIDKAELITKTAKATGKSERVIGYAYQVLRSKNHRSNQGSTLLEENGRVKFVPTKSAVV